MAKSHRVDPYRNFRFRIEIGGIQSAAFSDAKIPDSSTDPIEYRVGTDPNYPRKLSGLTKYGNVTLKRGVTDSLDLYKWRQDVITKGTDVSSVRKNISIILMDTSGHDKARWNLYACWPTKYETADLTGKGNDVLIETFEIGLEHMERVK